MAKVNRDLPLWRAVEMMETEGLDPGTGVIITVDSNGAYVSPVVQRVIKEEADFSAYAQLLIPGFDEALSRMQNRLERVVQEEASSMLKLLRDTKSE